MTPESGVYTFDEGTTADEIAQHHPSLTPADVYEASGYSLHRKDEVAACLRGDAIGLFVSVDRPERCPDGGTALVGLVPVDIFAHGDGGSIVVVAEDEDEDEDECTLCGRCLERYLHGVAIVKHYTPRSRVTDPRSAAP